MRYVRGQGVVNKYQKFRTKFVNVSTALVLVLTSMGGAAPLFFASKAFAQTSAIRQLAIMTGAQTIETNQASTPINVQTQNNGGHGESVSSTATLTLASTSSTGQFSNANATSGTCTGDWGITTLTMSSGSTNKAFCYRDTTAGTYTLDVTSNIQPGNNQTVSPASQQITVKDPAPAAQPILSTTYPSTTTVGTTNDFTTSISKNGAADQYVRVKVILADPTQAADATLVYEATPGVFIPMTFDASGVGYFGASAGFPLMDATTSMQVTFHAAGTYNATTEIVKASDDSVLGTPIHTSAVVTDAAPVDSTKPTATLSEPTADSFNPSQMVVVAHDETSLNKATANIYDESDTTLLKSCSQNANGATDFTATCAVPSLADGVYTIRANASDQAGHTSVTTIRQFTVDHTAPSVPTNGQPNGSYEKTNDFYFTWDGSTDASGQPVTYEFQSDNSGSFTSPWDSIANGNSEQNNLTSPKIHSTGAPDGNYYWRVRAIDAAGNKSAWSTTWNMTIDTVAPTVTVTPAGSLLHGTATFNITATDKNLDANASRVWVYLYKNDGNQESKGALVDLSSGHATFTVTTTQLPNGNYTFDVGRFADAAGNYSGNGDTYVHGYVIDNAKPSVAFVDPGTPTANSYVNGNFDVAFTAHDNYQLKSVNVSLYDTDPSHTNHWVATCYSSQSLQVTDVAQTCTVHLPANIPDGKYYVQVGAQDAATNWSVNATRTIYVQRATPNKPTGLHAKFQYDASDISNGSYLNKTAKPGNNNLELLWDTPTDWVTGYHILTTYPDGSTNTGYQGPNNNAWLNQNGFGQHGNGKYTYTVEAVNPNGTTVSDETFTLYYDTQSPTASFTTMPPTVVNGDFHVEGTASDNVALGNVFFDVRDANGWIAGCATTPNLTYDADHKNATISCDINTANLVNGQTYTLRIHAGDNTGYGGGQEQQLTIDRTAPTATIDDYSGTDTRPTLTGTVDDPTATVTVAIDGNAAQAATNNGDDTWSLAVTSTLAVGAHNVVATATDVATNTSSTAKTITVTAPAVTTSNTKTTTTLHIVKTLGSNFANTLLGGTTSFVPQVLGASTTAPTHTTTGHVLGDKTTSPSSQPSTQKFAAAADKKTANLFGLAWYWWLAILLAVVAFIFGAYRRANTDNKKA